MKKEKKKRPKTFKIAVSAEQYAKLRAEAARLECSATFVLKQILREWGAK